MAKKRARTTRRLPATPFKHYGHQPLWWPEFMARLKEWNTKPPTAT